MPLLREVADDAIEWLMLITVFGLVVNLAVAAPAGPLSIEAPKPVGLSIRESRAGTDKQIAIDFMVGEAKVRTWNPASIRNRSLEVLTAALSIIDEDEPQFTGQMVPAGMTLAQFHAMILREVGRRDAFGRSYRMRIEGAGKVDHPVLSRVQPFRRQTFDYPKGLGPQRAIRLNPEDMLIYDGVTAKFITNRADIELQADVAQALGLPPRAGGKPYRIVSRTDTADFTWGAALASIRALQPSNPQTDREIAVDLVPGGTNDQVQASFCRAHPSIYAEGRALSRNDAALAGGILGRVQARGNYQGDSVAVEGIMQPCS
jgi:hypothetical protein